MLTRALPGVRDSLADCVLCAEQKNTQRCDDNINCTADSMEEIENERRVSPKRIRPRAAPQTRPCYTALNASGTNFWPLCTAEAAAEAESDIDILATDTSVSVVGSYLILRGESSSKKLRARNG